MCTKMAKRNYVFVMLVFIFVVGINLSECRRGGGSSARRTPTRSPSNRRTTTYRSPQRATTPRYNIQTQQAYPNYNQPSYNRPSAAQKVTTPRYNIQTQQSYPNYNQPGYNRPGYNQPGYNQPHYNQPGYNQPHYNQPGYGQPGFPNSYSPGTWSQNNNHGVRNSVLAGLGGSALGLYLGYKLGGLSNGQNSPNYIAGPGGAPQYSVVHHYYHGDRPIPKDGTVEPSAIKKCDNVTFCTPNTTPLCMSNGTVYCIASLDSTITCSENSTELRCINSTITVPCDANSTNCNMTSLNTTTLSIPCVTTIDVFGDFGSNKLSVNKISKRAAEDIVTTTMETILSAIDNNSTSNVTESNSNNNETTSTSTTTALPVSMAQTANIPSNMITSQGISNKYCVTVIAEPYKAPVIPPDMNNNEFVKFVRSNNEVQADVNGKVSDVFNTILSQIFF